MSDIGHCSKLTADIVRELLDYNPTTGDLIWRPRHRGVGSDAIFNSMYAGKIAGSLDVSGYINIALRVTIGGPVLNCLAHRLVFLHQKGYAPKFIDHVNRIKSDNRLINLRPATNSQNEANKSLSKRNKSGHKGVSYAKDRGNWLACIRVNGKTKNLGRYGTPEEAAAAYNNAAVIAFGEFAHLNEVEEETDVAA